MAGPRWCLPGLEAAGRVRQTVLPGMAHPLRQPHRHGYRLAEIRLDSPGHDRISPALSIPEARTGEVWGVLFQAT